MWNGVLTLGCHVSSVYSVMYGIQREAKKNTQLLEIDKNILNMFC